MTARTLLSRCVEQSRKRAPFFAVAVDVAVFRCSWLADLSSVSQFFRATFRAWRFRYERLPSEQCLSLSKSAERRRALIYLNNVNVAAMVDGQTVFVRRAYVSARRAITRVSRHVPAISQISLDTFETASAVLADGARRASWRRSERRWG